VCNRQRNLCCKCPAGKVAAGKIIEKRPKGAHHITYRIFLESCPGAAIFQRLSMRKIIFFFIFSLYKILKRGSILERGFSLRGGKERGDNNRGNVVIYFHTSKVLVLALIKLVRRGRHAMYRIICAARINKWN
jgi:hypothetical protein